MSDSQQKRTREDIELKKNRKIQRNAEEQAMRKKTNRAIAIVFAVIVLFAAIVLIYNSNLLYRNGTAIKIEDESFTASDFNFYYNAMYNQEYSYYYQYYGELASYFISDAETLSRSAVEYMKQVVMLCDEAKAAGYTLDADAKQEIADALDTAKAQAKEYGWPSANAYLAKVYGKGMTLKIYEKNLEKVTLASNYSEEVYGSYEYSTEEISARYDEKKDDFDVYTFRYLYIDGSAVEAVEADEENGVEAVEGVDLDTAMAAALDIAEQFVGAVSSEQAFADLAYSLTESEGYRMVYTGSQLTTYLPAVEEWVKDSSRTEGDLEIIKNQTESSNGYYVVYYVDRSDNDYNMVNVRHILIAPEEVDSTLYENDPDGLAAAEKAKENEAYEEAKNILAGWKDGEATEETFAALADEHSSDTAEGGLYENVYKNQMVQEFNDWIYDSARQSGDTTILLSEDYGYHIIYFIGESDETYCDYLGDQDLRTEQYEAWETAELEKYEAKTGWFLRFANADITGKLSLVAPVEEEETEE